MRASPLPHNGPRWNYSLSLCHEFVTGEALGRCQGYMRYWSIDQLRLRSWYGPASVSLEMWCAAVQQQVKNSTVIAGRIAWFCATRAQIASCGATRAGKQCDIFNLWPFPDCSGRKLQGFVSRSIVVVHCHCDKVACLCPSGCPSDYEFRNQAWEICQYVKYHSTGNWPKSGLWQRSILTGESEGYQPCFLYICRSTTLVRSTVLQHALHVMAFKLYTSGWRVRYQANSAITFNMQFTTYVSLGAVPWISGSDINRAVSQFLLQVAALYR